MSPLGRWSQVETLMLVGTAPLPTPAQTGRRLLPPREGGNYSKLQCSGGPVEAGAERGQNHQVTLIDEPVLLGFPQSQGD